MTASNGESRDSVVVRIPRKAEWVAVARLAVAAVAIRLHFSYEEIEDLKLAVAEACTHAIRTETGETITVECEPFEDSLRVRIGTDDAEHEHDHADDIGLFLIRSLMDDVTYGRSGEILMTKRITT